MTWAIFTNCRLDEFRFSSLAGAPAYEVTDIYVFSRVIMRHYNSHYTKVIIS